MRAASEAAAAASEKQAEKSAEVKTNTAETVSPMEGIAGSAAKFNTEISAGVDKLSSLDGKTINVAIKTTQGLWTGGPAQAGQTYQVNELGQEGFLSSAGRLSPINKPKNALWRAPSSGTVIPAHIWSQMDIPKGGVQAGVRSVPTAANDGGLARLARQIQFGIASSNGSEELASVQAQQALEIGKLGRAVEKLTSKKWNVQVGVTPAGGSTYMTSVNSLL
jgi:hypothetical protein